MRHLQQHSVWALALAPLLSEQRPGSDTRMPPSEIPGQQSSLRPIEFTPFDKGGFHTLILKLLFLLTTTYFYIIQR